MSRPSVDVRAPAFVTLRVDSLAAALEAWTERLGIPVKLRGEGWAELQTETFLLTLVERADGPAAILGYEVDSVDAAAAELASHGLDRDDALASAGAGRRAAFRMPGGIALELIGT